MRSLTPYKIMTFVALLCMGFSTFGVGEVPVPAKTASFIDVALTPSQECDQAGGEWKNSNCDCGFGRRKKPLTGSTINTITGEKSLRGYECADDERYKTCRATIDKIAESKGKFIKSCKQSGMGKDCSQTLADCLDVRDSEEPSSALFPSIFGFQGEPTSNSRCSEYSYSDYRSELKELKQAEKDAKAALEKSQSEQISEQKESAKSEKSIQNETLEMFKDREKEISAENQEFNKLETDQQQTQAQLAQSLRKLESGILKIQIERANAVQMRAAQVNDYKLDLIKCKINAEKDQQLSGGPLIVSGVSRASQKGGSRASIGRTSWEICVKKVLINRDSQAIAFKNQMVQYDDLLSNANAERKDVMAAIEMETRRAPQAKQDQANKNANAASAFENKKMLKNQELNELNLQKQQELINISTKIAAARSAVIQSSNDVSNLQTEKPKGKGSHTQADAQEALETFARGDCDAECSGLKRLDNECTNVMQSKKSSGVKGLSNTRSKAADNDK